MRSVAALLLAITLVGCGGAGQAKLEGQLYTRPGEKLKLESNEQAFLSFTGVGADGKPSLEQSYPCQVNPDGTFEMIASGGVLPPGTYRVTLDLIAMKMQDGQGGRPQQIDRFSGRFSRDRSKLDVEVKRGSNKLDVVLSGS